GAAPLPSPRAGGRGGAPPPPHDAARNPQDVDDAALAAAVYLCSGDGDLSTVVGQRAAVYRYNHSQAYVDLVLKIMNAYLEGDFTSVPNNSTAAGYVVPEPPSFEVRGPGKFKNGKGSTEDTTTGSPTPPAADPAQGAGSGDGGVGGTPAKPTQPKPSSPELPKTNTPLDPVIQGVDEGVGAVTSTAISGILGLLTKQEAATACQAEFPKLTQTVQLLNCLLSYGLKP
ncbi:hypothetical protein KU893_07725, partial [Nocardioides daeguensis]|nr:hypothetical protein [Nocardioides daeguensis]